jgi:uncharacterized protein (DUF736 family)
MSAKTTRVGVAWKKQTPDGKPYLSVVITNPVGQDFRFTIWPVDDKRSEQSPDYTVTKSAAQPADPNSTASFAAPSTFPSNDEEVPF